MAKGGKFFNEFIRHFTCGACGKWFAIGDAPEDRNEWSCPWCGKEQVFKMDEDSPQ